MVDLRGQCAPLRSQPCIYDDLSLLRLPHAPLTLGTQAPAHPSPLRCELELSYARKGRTTAMLVTSCMVSSIDEQGFALSIDGRVFDHVAVARVTPATALTATAAGFREQHVSLPIRTYSAVE